MAVADLHFFEFSKFEISKWSYGQLLRYLPPELSSLTRRGHRTVIEEATTNEALLSVSSATQFAVVSVRYESGSLRVGCSCGDTSGRICVFQLQAILNVIENPDVRIFFDEEKRQNLIRLAGEKYGLEAEPDLSKEFELVWYDHQPVVKPVNEHLQRVDEESLRTVARKLAPVVAEAAEWNEAAIRILVWTQSRFGENFQLSVYEAFRTSGGKLRGPMRRLDAVDLLLDADSKTELKFYGAVAKFQDTHRTTGQVTDKQAFYWLLQNPGRLPVFIHQFGVSEAVAAHALREVEMVVKKMDMALTVYEKGDFFEITGELTIEGKPFDLLDAKLSYGGFLLAGERLHLIEREGFDALLDYLQQHRNLVVIHRSKYEVFRREVLEKVEGHTRVIYTYLRSADKRQRREMELDSPPEKIVYLDDAGQYVHLTPVMRYGAVEMPVLSPRLLYLVDKQGKAFKADRDVKKEIAFGTSVMLSHPDFSEQLGQDYIYLHKSKFLDENWFLRTFQEWRSEGFQILGFNRIKGNRFNGNAAKVSVTVVSGVDWFESKIEVSFGEERVPLRQLFTSVRNKTRYIALSDGTVGILPEVWMERLAGYFRIGTVSGEVIKNHRYLFQSIRDHYDGSYFSPTVQEEIRLLSESLEKVELIPDVVVPSGLKTSLRDYQYEGVKWLSFMSRLSFGACLADDMGLGKTLQVIAFLLLQKEEYPGRTNLVVMPASLLFNWQQELEKHAPGLRFCLYYGDGRKMGFAEQQQYDLVLTTYSVMVADIHLLRQNSYHYVVLDESQNIKNPGSQRYRAACQLKARNRIIMTGTPVENNTYDVFGQFSFVCPGLLGSRRYFKDRYFMPVDKFRESARTEELQARIRPFMLRRTKEQVARELPRKSEMTVFCEMGADQRRVYDAYAAEFRNYLNGKSDGDIAREKLHVLQGLTKLRQICISPSILNDEEYYGGESAKITVLMEHLTNLVTHHKVLVFSQFVTVLDLIRRELDGLHIGYSYLVGSTTNRGEVVGEFQEDETKRVFLISLKAGGTGLNLTAADYVFLMDPWWNPATENQAIDRAHRIGQEKQVVAVRMICPDTIEERVLQLQQSKKELTEELIQSEESIAKVLNKDELLGLV